jgi:hypothetical protein
VPLADVEADEDFDEFDDEDEDSPFVDHPFIIDQSTPIDSVSPSPAPTQASTPNPERRTQPRTNTS